MLSQQPALGRRQLVLALLSGAYSVGLAAATAPIVNPTSTEHLKQGRRLAPEFERIKQRGELLVAMLGTDTPPFFFVQDQRLQGFDVDLAREIAKSLGVQLRFDRSAASFNEVVDKVSRNEADLGISKISRTLQRSQAVLFSQPYLTLYHGLLLNRVAYARLAGEKPPALVLRDFRGTLGVIAQSSFHDFALVNFPNAQIRPYPNWVELVAAVRRGELVAAYRDELEVKRVLVEQPRAALTLRTITIKDQQDALGVAVGTGSTSLLAYINQMIEGRSPKLTVTDILKAIRPLDH